jgi:hypothetical protein
MILAFKKGLTYKGTVGGEEPGSEENIFPLMNLPLTLEGEEMELNDFQWWAYSDKWQKWLDANPREWQAESEDRRFKKAESILEGAANFSNPVYDYVGDQIKNLVSGNKVQNFSSYINEAADDDSDINAEALRKFQKLNAAIQKLIKDGELKSDLNMEDIPEDSPQAVIVDFFDGEGQPVPASRSALRVTKKYEVGELILCEMDYTIPAGEVTDPEDLMEKTMDYAKDAVIAIGAMGAGYLALTAVGGIFTTWTLAKTGYGIYKWARPASLASRVSGAGGLSTLKNFASRLVAGRGATSLANAGRVVLPSGAFVKGGLAYSTRATGNVLLRGAAAQSVKQAAAAQLASRGAAAAAGVGARAAASGGAGAVVAAESTNPVGWILLALQVIGSGVNQLWNWYSDKQAPRYGEVEDFAYGTFNPKNIPLGRSITVCWTSDGGASGWDVFFDILTAMKDDTRTTMELVKIGEAAGRSIFVLMQVNSEMLQKIVTDNNIVMLSFSNTDKFERGTFDNDDLEFQIAAIPEIADFTIGTSLVGYCDWRLLEKTYGKAPDYPMCVPKDALEKYRFNYSNSDGKRINTEGTLLTDTQIQDLDLAEIMPLPGEGSLRGASVSESVANYILEKNEALTFSEFTKLAELTERKEKYDDIKAEIEAEVKKELGVKVAPEDEPVVKTEKPEKEAAEEVEAPEAPDYGEGEWETEYSGIELASVSENDWGQYPVIIYKVDSIEFVDPNDTDDAGDYKYFVVDETSKRPSDGDPVLVEVTSLDEVETPRYGFAEYVAPPEPEEDTEETEEVEVSTPDGEEMSMDDLVVKTRKNSTVLRDKDARGGTNPLDEFGSEELKRDLGISDWDNITYAKVRYDREHEPKRIILKNNLAKIGDRKRVVKKGELGFDAALRFATKLEAAIKYA